MNSKLFKTISGYHFGQAIKEYMESQPGGVHEAANKLGYNVLSLYPIFRKADVNTSLLKKIGEVYDTNPFVALNLCGSQEPSDKELEGKRSFNDQSELEAAWQRVEVLEAERNGLTEQIKLLREMVDFLKERDK